MRVGAGVVCARACPCEEREVLLGRVRYSVLFIVVGVARLRRAHQRDGLVEGERHRSAVDDGALDLRLAVVVLDEHVVGAGERSLGDPLLGAPAVVGVGVDEEVLAALGDGVLGGVEGERKLGLARRERDVVVRVGPPVPRCGEQPVGRRQDRVAV